eukprot:4072381-Prorocentrum_lima.AAC.1
MTSSLVGSEMCIRDRILSVRDGPRGGPQAARTTSSEAEELMYGRDVPLGWTRVVGAGVS